jgi:hypothetical protein
LTIRTVSHTQNATKANPTIGRARDMPVFYPPGRSGGKANPFACRLQAVADCR